MAGKGNNPEKWNQLLEALDEKMQFGLLTHLQRVKAYHFETDTLLIEPATVEDEKYLGKEVVLQQLVVFAEDATGIKSVKIKSPLS